ncbi:hypothetical protein [Amycolatopsis sp. lyj-346]|uniref:hypothetical protein n=1 Tax=Amycolatopsis sp. lyj-346 TaxID=2789289 RepID=UPI00397A267D
MIADSGHLSPEAIRRRRPETRARAKRAGGALTTIRLLHTLVWLSVESCMAYLLYAGFAKRSDRRAAIAGAAVITECTVFVLHFRNLRR